MREKKLVLKRETVRELTAEESSRVGGGVLTTSASCETMQPIICAILTITKDPWEVHQASP